MNMIMKELTTQPQRIVVIGDVFVASQTMADAIKDSRICCGEIRSCFWGNQDKQEFTARQLKLERGGPEATAYAPELESLLQDADIVMTHFCPLPRALLEQAPKLKLILTCRGGLEHIDVSAASARGIPVVNVIRNAEPVADFALGMMLDITRNISLSHYQMKHGQWSKKFYNSDNLKTLNSFTVGLAGIGNVGIAVARRLKALGVPMIAFDAYTSAERLQKAGLSEIRLVDSLETLFESADIISLHLRLTPETEHMIDGRYFSRMKKSAYFLNTARGGLVNQEALTLALQRMDIAGAALDVYDSEPLPSDSPLLHMDNVLLTPHIAGTTVDAIPMAPHMLMREVNRIFDEGNHDRIVNRSDITLE